MMCQAKEKPQQSGGVSIGVESGSLSIAKDLVGKNSVRSETYIETFEVKLLGDNLIAVIDALKSSLTPESNVLHKLRETLRQLRLAQKRINELKHIHNMLHELEVSLEGVMQSIAANNIMTLKLIWNSFVKRDFAKMKHFASEEMQYLDQVKFHIEEGDIMGPVWILELWHLKMNFEQSLMEGAQRESAELAAIMLEKCRHHLFNIDRKLLTAVTQLDDYSEQIYRAVNHG